MRGTRTAFVGVLAGLALLCAPGVAAADVVFDQVDAQDLADTLAEATEAQGVCYGWNINIDDQYTGTEGGTSTGSNLGPGRSLDTAGTQCNRRVEFRADITYTSDSSESEDYASWSVSSLPSGPSTEDLDALALFDEDDLIGDDPDIAVDKAVNALPQLTADAGAAKQIEATPERQQPANAGQLTDNPGNDFFRRAGGTLLFGAIMLIAGVVFTIFILRNSKSNRSLRPVRSGGGGEPPVGEWAEQQHQPTLNYPPPAYPPPSADARMDGPPRLEPPTEPIKSQDTPPEAAPGTPDDAAPERTQKIDPPPAGGSTSDSDIPERTQKIDPPRPSESTSDDSGPERTEKLDPRQSPGDAQDR